jgi:hypothetical protein
MICQSILAAERIIWDTEIPVSGGECRFCNMDRLWELAIWTAFRKAAINNNGMSVEFHPLAKMKMMLLMDGGPRIDPDIVIYREGKPFIIADAKYSESKSAVADDVYQIVCYTQRLKAEKGILIYLSAERGWFSSLGFSADGSELLAAGIDKTESVALNLTTTALNTLSVG